MMTKIKYLLLASRPISWVNTAYPFAAGYLMTVRAVDPILIIGTFFFLIPYNLLMYGINDVFDYESDMQNPRKGGIEGAQLAKSLHRLTLVASIGLSVPFIIYLLAVSHQPVGGLVLAVDIFLVLAYSLPKLRFKERPFIDSMTSASHFVGPLVYALTFTHFTVNYLIIVVAFFLWGMASHAFGAVQDIIADRKAGIGSIATVIGARYTVRLAAGLYLASAILLLTLGWLGLIIALVELLYVANVSRFWNIDDKHAEIANRGWRRFLLLNWIAGFMVTLVLIYLFKHG